MDRAGVHTHDPRKGDLLWLESRQKAGKQPNGKITRVWKEDGEISEVWVDFEANQDGTVDRNVAISFTDMQYSYTNAIQGFVINDVSGA